MPDITKENRKYFTAVLQSVADLHKTETDIENNKKLFAQFTDFLTKNAEEIGKFQAVENEIVDYLQKFSFDGNADFTPAKNKLVPLPAIRQKLVEMGEEAKKLARKPDRYNCFKAMESCKQLALFCQKEMKSADYDKVTAALEKNIPALRKIQQEFEKEDKILADIKETIKKRHAVVNKYTAYSAELQQFVANFPTNRDSDLKTTEQRLSALEDINKQAEEIGKQLSQIKNYADRFNKSNVQRQAEQILSSVYAQMKFSDTGNSKASLQQQFTALKNLIAAFEKERKDTVVLRDNRKKTPSDIWQEDNEQLISELEAIIKKGTEKQVFSLQSFQSRIQTAASKKGQDIAATEQKYKWLKRSRYDSNLNYLKNTYITFSNFQSEIESILQSRGLFTKLIEMIVYN